MSDQKEPFDLLKALACMDRRWIFLAMALAVAGPIIWVGITGKTFPESARAPVYGAFNTIQNAAPGSKVLISFDFDPASAGELQPMATALLHHCAARGHKLYCMTLWAPATPLIDSTLNDVVIRHFGTQYTYGQNYVNLGFQAGNEGVMKQLITNVPGAFPNDSKGTPVGNIPMMEGIKRINDFDVLVSVSAGYPGAKEWVQYCVSTVLTSDDPIKFVAGSTGVQTPQIMPYFPVQMAGVLGAIKGAAEYEYLVNSEIEKMDGGKPVGPEFKEAQRRMAPQLVAHILMVGLIILGNLIFFLTRGARATA
jgi:hypothetical protein